ncbi:acyl carrier protein [Hymenobacter gummosus]|uniref:Acyl carrier protein n=2 Tax=Hymenobacter gummosus TaxID=1776032 RepID=A0A431UAB5_9BACT|nr:acyl carrier protein [Hymenobacter gummosus]
MLATPSLPSGDLTRHVKHLIRRRKGVPLNRLRPTADLQAELGFDTLDLVDIILELEQHYRLTIPDEVPLRTINDFVQFLSRQQSNGSSARAA